MSRVQAIFMKIVWTNLVLSERELYSSINGGDLLGPGVAVISLR